MDLFFTLTSLHHGPAMLKEQGVADPVPKSVDLWSNDPKVAAGPLITNEVFWVRAVETQSKVIRSG